MSLAMTLGAKGNLLDTQGKETPPVMLDSPVLFDSELEHIKNHPKLKTQTIAARYAAACAAGASRLALTSFAKRPPRRFAPAASASSSRIVRIKVRTRPRFPRFSLLVPCTTT